MSEMEPEKVQATVDFIVKLEELRLIAVKSELNELIDSIPSLLKLNRKISINDGLMIVAGR
jgi:hypothetical protein